MDSDDLVSKYRTAYIELLKANARVLLMRHIAIEVGQLLCYYMVDNQPRYTVAFGIVPHGQTFWVWKVMETKGRSRSAIPSILPSKYFPCVHYREQHGVED